MYRDKRYMAFSIFAVILSSILLAKSYHSTSRAPYKNTIETTEAGGAQAFPGFPVDVNSAYMEELTMLPGIGVKTAQRIVDVREETGGFSSVDEFAMSARLGKSRIEKIRPLIMLGGGRR